MGEPAYAFTDGVAYERFMGRWSRRVGAVFLDWLALPNGLRWLDVGCGTGVFTKLIAETCAPSGLSAIDPSPEQVAHARQQPAASLADFRVGDAQALPYADGDFDVIASALVINFIADRPRALAEMRRVAKAGGTVAGYVWDFAARRAPPTPLGLALRRCGHDVPAVPGGADSALHAFRTLFTNAGLWDVDARSIDVTVTFSSFDDLWTSLTPSYSPTTRIIDGLTETERAKVMDALRADLPASADGTISYASRASAVKARVAG